MSSRQGHEAHARNDNVADTRPQNYEAQIDAEVAARAVNHAAADGAGPDWYSPHIDSALGVVKKAWVERELILCETDKHALVAIRKADGYELLALPADR